MFLSDGPITYTEDLTRPSDRRYLSEGSIALIDPEPTDRPTDAQPLEITKEVATTELIAS